MGVSIDIDIDASDARSKVESLRAEIKSLEDEDFDLDFEGEFGDVLDDFDDFLDRVEEVKLQLQDLDSEIGDALADLDDTTIDIRKPDGETHGTGGGTDPPTPEMGASSRDRSLARTARHIENRLDLPSGSIDDGMMEGFDGRELDKITRRFQNIVDGRENLAHFLPGEKRAEGFEGEIVGDFGFGKETLSQHLQRQAELGQEAVNEMADESAERLDDIDFDFVPDDGDDILDLDFLEENDVIDFSANEAISESDFNLEEAFGSQFDELDLMERRLNEIGAPEADSFLSDQQFREMDRVERLHGRLNQLDLDENLDLTGDESKVEALQKRLDAVGAPDARKRSLIGTQVLDDIDKVDLLNRRIQALDDGISARDLLPDIEEVGDIDDLFNDDGRLQFNWAAEIGKDIDGLDDALTRADRSWSRFGQKLRKFKPSMRFWYNIIAALLPVMIALGIYALGAAAAIGSIAVAAGSLIGLGLLGHANDMGEAFNEAQERVSEFKEELFEVFQVPMQQFAPIQADLFDYLPARLTEVSREMEGLVAYEDTIFQFFDSLIGGVAEFIRILVRNEQQISQLSMRFGQMAGSGLLNFFEWLIMTLYENQNAFVELWNVVKDLLVILARASIFIGKFAIALGPLIDIVRALTSVLQNDAVAAIVTFVSFIILMGWMVTSVFVKVGMLIQALQKLRFILLLLGGGSILNGIKILFATWINKIRALIVWVYQAYGAMAALATMTAVATGGLALIAGAGSAALSATSGPSTPSGMGGAAGGYGGGVTQNSVVYNDNSRVEINNSGGMDNASEQRIRSTIEKTQSKHNAMDVPDTDYNTDLTSSNEGK